MRKYYKMILVLMVSLCNTSVVLSAQEVDRMKYSRDVNGVEVGIILTRNFVVANFGEPTRYEEQDSGDNGVNRWYYYGDSYIHTKDHVFDEFAVSDTVFAAFTNQIPGGLKVGDPLSKLDNFKYGKPVQYRDFEDCLVYSLFDTTDSPVDLYVKDGIIVDITYHDPM